MSSLPKEKIENYSDRDVRQFFDRYFVKQLSFSANEVDTVVDFFKKRGFDETAAVSTTIILLEQARLDNVSVFKLLDTLQGLTEVQLSQVVTEILNYNRPRTSSIGYKTQITSDRFEKRNIKP
jgi:hypothetical protein